MGAREAARIFELTVFVLPEIFAKWGFPLSIRCVP